MGQYFNKFLTYIEKNFLLNSNPPKDKTVQSAGMEKHPSLSKTTMDKEKRKKEETTREAAQ